ncbi:MAG TPA: TVP38/TMEM64 family protein [Terrimicrobiaceae bacterium]
MNPPRSSNLVGAAAKSGKESSLWKWIASVAVLVILFGVARLFPVTQWLEAFNQWVGNLGPWSIAIFIGAYVLATVLLLPGSVLTIGAGFVFGLGWGLFAVSIGSTLGAASAFLISRFVAREKVEAMARENENFFRIDRAIGAQGAKLILLLRLSPLIPFNISNYLYGLTAVKFWPYVLASWIGMLPGTLLYVYLGAAGKAGLQAASGADAGRSPLEWIFLGFGLVATIAVTIWVTKIARTALRNKDVT